MGVRIRRFSKVVKTPKNPPPPEPPKKKTPYKHKFPAVTRIEKIMDAEKPYPQSTRNKIYFKSNDYGTGFQDQHDIEFPAHIPIQKMKDQVNLATYKNWSDYRDHSERDHFKGKDKYTNIIVKVGCGVLVLFVIPVLLGLEIEEVILLLIFASIILALLGVINSFYTFSLMFPQFEIDERTIKAVMDVLTKLNINERETHPNGPRFVWSCSEDCLWIAIEILRFEDDGSVISEGKSAIEEVSARFESSKNQEQFIQGNKKKAANPLANEPEQEFDEYKIQILDMDD